MYIRGLATDLSELLEWLALGLQNSDFDIKLVLSAGFGKETTNEYQLHNKGSGKHS